jgi:glycosyltransferase involved in cell wall biosynthesis
VTWFAATLSRRPFSFTGHAKDIYEPSLSPAGLLPRKLRAASFAVTCTAANVAHLQRLAADTPVHLVYHGLNPDFARLVDGTPAHHPGGPFRVASVGRMVEKKGFDVLVDAIVRLRRGGVDARLVVAGEPGPAEHAVDELITRHGLAAVVERRGPLGQPELFALLGECHAFALACRVASDGDRDGIPNVLVEAMAAGVPVVSTRVSGIPELVTDGVDGLLVAPEDPDAVASALRRLAVEPATRERLAAAGRATVATRFDGDVLARELATLMGASR